MITCEPIKLHHFYFKDLVIISRRFFILFIDFVVKVGSNFLSRCKKPTLALFVPKNDGQCESATSRVRVVETKNESKIYFFEGINIGYPEPACAHLVLISTVPPTTNVFPCCGNILK